MPRRRRLFERKETTRHGKTVWYFRRPGGKRVRLPGVYGSQEYLDAYAKALACIAVDKAPPAEKGTLAWLVQRYKASGHFASLAPTSQTARDYILKGACKDAGGKSFARITRKHIQEAMDRRAKTPHGANNFLVAMSVLFKWAVSNDLMESNPCDGVARRKDRIIGHHTWTLDEVAQFRAKHPVGTKPRLALDLLLFTGLRRSDVITVGRQNVKDGILTIRAQKNKTGLQLPIFSELQASIDATPTGEMIFLTNKRGQPFHTGQSFSQWFQRQAKKAGLSDECTAHGVRKAGATIAANNGATPHELMAMFGWSKISMAEVYTKEADKARLARGAAERIANNSKAAPRIVAGSSAKK
jgi:site-specific recombinase XerD